MSLFNFGQAGCPQLSTHNMHFILQSLHRHLRRPNSHHSRRTFVDTSAIRWVRDRGLDHAVERERNLRPVLNLKDLIKSEPSKSLPLSIIAEKREALGIPHRPIEFVRRYPSVFEEFLPGGIGIHPHVKLTPEVLDIDSDEQLVYQSDNYRQQAADRLLKLLMLGRIHKIPLHIVDRLRRDLGLPQDYTKTIVPEFPDYFQVTGQEDGDSTLELVCWSNELAVSIKEKKALTVDLSYEKGKALAFPVQYSRGFEIDKKFKKWVDEWQKLPYISPYENASHLSSKSDESDKWVVAILHELLHLLMPRKTERENILCLGDYLGIRSRFKRALLQHPGIFYLSSKIGTHTVVLREGYKRNLLIAKDPLMDMRYRYIHLMNMLKEDKKPKRVQSGGTKEPKLITDSQRDEENDDSEELYDLSDSEMENETDDGCTNDDEDEYENMRNGRRNLGVHKGRSGTAYQETRRPSRPRDTNSLEGRNLSNKRSTISVRVSRKVKHGRHENHLRPPERLNSPRNRNRPKLEAMTS